MEEVWSRGVKWSIWSLTQDRSDCYVLGRVDPERAAIVTRVEEDKGGLDHSWS